jgi:hypothetical protein
LQLGTKGNTCDVIFKNIPPFFARALKVEVTPQFFNPYLRIAVKGVPIMAESLSVTVYPENVTKKGKPCLKFSSSTMNHSNEPVLFSDKPDRQGYYTDTLFMAHESIIASGKEYIGNATVLIINNSFNTVSEVKVSLDQGHYTGSVNHRISYQSPSGATEFVTENYSVVIDSINLISFFGTYSDKSASFWTSSPDKFEATIKVDDYTKTNLNEDQQLEYRTTYAKQSTLAAVSMDINIDSINSKYTVLLDGVDVMCDFSTNDESRAGESSVNCIIPGITMDQPLTDVRLLKGTFTGKDNFDRIHDVVYEFRRSAIP